MPWEPIVAFPDDFPRGTQVKKAKLYADEDIEDEIVDALRGLNVNIKGAREIAGHRGKDDGFHAAFAFKERRFLITKNGKHYLDDRRVPFNRTHGVIVLEGDFGAESDYIETLRTLFHVVVPYGGIYKGAKLRLSRNRITIRFVDHEGRLLTERYKVERGVVYAWND